MVLASLIGFHVGPHAHLTAGALGQIGASSATKIVLPMELASLVNRLRGPLDMAASDNVEVETPSRNGGPGLA